MDWFSIVIVVVILALVIWAVNRATAGYYRAEIARLERKIDFLYRKFELDYAREQAASLPAQVRELAATGRKLEAIKAYREATGADLVTAKNAVESLNSPQAAYPPQRILVDYPGTAPTGLNLTPEIMALVEQGNKIQAIKRYRELTGAGLKEAKDKVEVYEREIRLK